MARVPLSSEHEALGRLLRAARTAAGLTTRQLGFSSGHVSNVEGGFVAPSQELANRYIELGADREQIRVLLAQIAARSARRASGALAGSSGPTAITANTEPDDVRLRYRVERYDVHFEFNDAGGVESVSSRVGLRAVDGPVSFYYTGHSPNRRTGSDDYGDAFSNIAGATLELVNTTAVGAFDAYFRLATPITPEDPEPYLIEYTIQVGERERAEPEITYVTRPGIAAHALTVTFADLRPDRLWWFGSPNGMAASRPLADHEVTPARPGHYAHIFDPVVAGWMYGFTWSWA